MSGTPKLRWYEIRIRGVLGETLLEAFAELHVRTEGGTTVLSGEVKDQAALHGMLAQIDAFGLELLAVNSETDEPGEMDRWP
jgi:hypothetical protein